MTVKEKSFKENSMRIILFAAILYVGIQAVIQSGNLAAKDGEEQESLSTMFAESIAEAVEEVVYKQFMPGIVYGQSSGIHTNWLVQEQIDSVTPLYGYLVSDMSESDAMEQVQRKLSEEAEVQETEASNINTDVAKDTAGEEQTENQGEGLGELTELLMAENQAAIQSGLEQAQEQVLGETTVENIEELKTEEGEGDQGITAFVPRGQVAQVDLAALQNYQTLLQQFYTVDANTSTSSERLNVTAFLEKDMTISKEGESPQILIFHTHSQEGFADSVAGDESTTIIGVGDYLAKILEETYGYQVLHHTGKYDVDSRDDAYSAALPEIEKLLADNPSIQVVIDLHRDQMPEETKLVMDLDGRPTARFMFFNGLSRTKTTGNISYLYNENLDRNLAFSFQMQMKAAEYYPGLTRKIYLKGYRYNMHLKDKFLLVELGAQNNTLEEAMNACDPLAHILDMVLSGN